MTLVSEIQKLFINVIILLTTGYAIVIKFLFEYYTYYLIFNKLLTT